MLSSRQAVEAFHLVFLRAYDDYRSKVVSFLEPEQAAPFASRAAWDELQERVVSELESLR